MRIILLTAKKFAMQDNAEFITILHLKSALETLRIVDKEAEKLIYEYLDFKPILTAKIKESDLKEAEEYSKINFDEDVKNFKNYMESHGYSTSSKISIIYSDKKNRIISLRETTKRIEESLKSQLFGQDEAIEAICDKIVESSYNLPTNAPKAIYFFLGPPATGKTMLSQLIAKELEGYKFKLFDMTQFTSSNQGFALFGLEEGYKDAREGKLTKFVKENPKSVIVFDEIEKAHPSILSNFLTLLSSGKIEDAYTEEEVDFTQTIVVFTSNLGSELYNNNNFLELLKKNKEKASSMILETISREEKNVSGENVKVLSPEFLSRISQGEIVLFNKLSFNAILNIVKNKIFEVQNKFESYYGIEIEFSSFNDIASLFILSQAPLIDIRKLKSKLPLKIFDKITDYIRENEVTPKKVKFEIDKDSSKKLKDEILSLDEDSQKKFLHRLFRKNETFLYDISESFDNETLTFSFSNLSCKQLEKSADFTGQGAIVFEVPKISFKDIAGHKVAKKRLLEIIKILKSSKDKTKQLNIEIPKGMLLYGPPGTGKTMLAKAFANEADLPFIQTTGSEILDINLMKSIFKKAKEYAPAIIFIDEIDAIGRRGYSNYDVQINQFLTELNGFNDNIDERIFVIAATNLKEKLDPAILRSGRMDLHIQIDTLDREAREFFIDKILKKPKKGEFDKEKILTYTAGMSGADLEKVSREVSLYLFRNNLDELTQEILIEQINTIKYGSRITHKSISKLIKSTAIHEAGHAVLSKLLMPEIKIEQITVIPRANTLGFVSYDQDELQPNLSREEIKNKLIISFAGREAQIKEYGEENGIDSGASSDLAVATRYAYNAVALWGMGEDTGYINISDFNKAIFEKEIETEVKKLLENAKKECKKLIDEHWDKISKLADLLIKQEVVTEKEFLGILKDG